jgi:hypothetical protein
VLCGKCDTSSGPSGAIVNRTAALSTELGAKPGHDPKRRGHTAAYTFNADSVEISYFDEVETGTLAGV